MIRTPGPTARRAAARARPGVALVMAVVAMAVLGALVTGVFFAALREQRDGRDSVNRVRALAAAEYGLAAALSPGVWRPSWKVTARRGVLAAFDGGPEAGASHSVRLWKLTRNSFLVASAGASGTGDSRAARRLSLLVTLRVPALAASAAVIASGVVTVADSSLLSGIDTVPPGRECPPGEGARPAIVVPAVSRVVDDYCTAEPCIAGLPPVRGDALAGATDSYQRFGATDRDALVAAASRLGNPAIVATPGPRLDGEGECNVALPDNLGDPLLELGSDSPCADHLPLLHAPGNMRIEGGAAQGMLLVDGDLELAAGARFSGVVLVRGVLEITDGSVLHGTVLASNAMVHGGSRLRYSSCAVERALRAAAEPVVPEGIAWSELY